MCMMNKMTVKYLAWFLISYAAFHDCVGPDGCDGCLNIDDPSNAGLSDIIDRLTRVRAGSRRVPEFTVRMLAQ